MVGPAQVKYLQSYISLAIYTEVKLTYKHTSSCLLYESLTPDDSQPAAQTSHPEAWFVFSSFH